MVNEAGVYTVEDLNWRDYESLIISFGDSLDVKFSISTTGTKRHTVTVLRVGRIRLA